MPATAGERSVATAILLVLVLGVAPVSAAQLLRRPDLRTTEACVTDRGIASATCRSWSVCPSAGRSPHRVVRVTRRTLSVVEHGLPGPRAPGL